MTHLVRTCRFCDNSAHTDWLIKYGPRHYAHPKCFYSEKENYDLDTLPAYERAKFDEWFTCYAAS